MSDPEKEPKTAPASVSVDDAPTVIRSSPSPHDEVTWLSSSARPPTTFAVPAPGQMLAGRYMVFDTLGQGGMGVVLAAYDTRLDRRVALKLLHPIDASDATATDGEARLVREAQAMARLNHPHVVAVYDAGPLEAGSLFIAMEYVEGQTLRQWCDQQPRSWREVLDTYLSAGKGLVAAHAAGLIHRDFKPDNVLIGKDGRIRVMDFGLARSALDLIPSEQFPASLSADTLSSALTIPGTLMGTPKYMAPELLRGKPAGVRSDLYAFCVALYEALYGQLPFPDRSMAEYSRARREGLVTPPPASSDVPAWVTRTVLQGLQADPQQRPASMEALLALLLDDPAIKRQARRRVLAMASVAGVLAALALWGWARQHAQAPTCSQVARRLDGVWDASVKQKVLDSLHGTGLPYADATAERVSTALDSYASQWIKQSTALCEAEQATQLPRLAALRESCLERRRSRLHALTELLSHGSEPALLEKATQSARSLPPLEDCADDEALTAAVPPPEDPAVRAQVEKLLGTVDIIEALYTAGQYKEGLATAEKLLPQVEAAGHPPLHAQLLLLMAQLKDGSGDYKGSEALARQALSEAARGRDSLQMSRAMSLLVRELDRQRRFAEAAPLAPAVRAMADSTGNELTQATAYSVLGRMFTEQGKYPEAWESLSQALVLREKALGPEHPDSASTLSNLATVAWWMGRYDESLERTQRAAALKENALGPEHPEAIQMLTNMGAMLYEVGRYEEALQRFERALELEQKVLGPDYPHIASTLTNLGIVLLTLGRPEEARRMAERAVAFREKLSGPDAQELAGPLTSLGGALEELGRHEEALQAHTRATQLREKTLGPDHDLVSESLRQQALVLTHLKRFREAHERIDRALAIAEKALGKEHPDLSYPLQIQGELFLAEGRAAEALPPLERAQKLAPKGAIRAEVGFSLAQALWEARSAERARAVELATQAREDWQRIGHAERVARSTRWLAAHPRP
ncbi:tetratricopeptide repeat protein [Hyalangium versicolor]|uniref:tetratricopeptide repeat protein n=1 Tax=Hyalangium versicolor TaxID=2861190 RepID=UPI001CCFCF44|nr:tetratricopeptide repeat protein [Hyalangium versicolor]